MKNFLATLKEIAKGKSLIRTMMNLQLRDFTLSGNVLDIGGGRQPSYLRFFKKDDNMRFESVDLTGERKIDLEKDSLPYDDASIDQVLLFNILEHIYNHKFLVGEVYRVLKSDGIVIGFVPFLVGYHPDPHDYFRYTAESLNRIFQDAGFGSVDVREVGRGPFLVNFNTIMDYMPRMVRIALFTFYALLDCLVLRIKPKLSKKFVLGYLFKVRNI